MSGPRPQHRLAAVLCSAALAIGTLVGCGVRGQSQPQPIDRPTPTSTPTPTLDQSRCPSTTSASGPSGTSTTVTCELPSVTITPSVSPASS